ncbi:restriction endonuclease subunit S [Antarcticimicrobium sediminis]|uniref:Restriction endonuclease subunit S n=1 Tax=Antarcticimicrobium sediminis TaxID=2546227 RepID=A0A4R5EK23_9RHOB|nr:restriction endonuclease subunit S [Antarcticimicrobium sediminis]TDE34824.1 restriction endonuclease subunit S [Antarcticimicrobium sediminis]
MSEVNPRVLVIPNYQDWEYRALEQLCVHVGRGTAPRYVEQSDVKAIGQRCVAKTGFDPSFARPHSERAMGGTLHAVDGDVLLNSTGTGTIGRSVVFRESGSFIVDGHVTALRPKESKCSSVWLSAVLQSPWGQEHLERFCYAGSTNQVELSASALRVSEVPTPPYNEQSKIAEVLDTLDVAIRGTEAVVAKLKAIKQGLLHDLLTRGIDANGDLRPPQPEAPHLYKQTPLGWLPKEWETSKLPGLAQPNRPVIRTGPFGSSLKGEHWRETGRPVITIGSFGENGFIEEELLFIDEKKAMSMIEYEVHPGDLVFSRVADVGRSLVVEDSETGWIMSSNLMRISVERKKLLPSLLHVQLRHSVRLRKQMSQLVNSAGRDVANSAVLLALDIAVPPVGEQTEIEKAIACNDDKLVQEEQQLGKLRLQKSGLMDDLLTGRKPATPLL